MIIGSYYYAWYSGNWLKNTVRYNDPPVLGEYNNTIYSDVIKKQIVQMLNCGINFMSISWTGRSSYDHVIEIAEKEGIKVSCFYESLYRASKNKKITLNEMPSIINDLKIISDYFSEECYLKINNRPVLMLYVTRNYDLSVIKIIREMFDNVYLVGDELFWNDINTQKVLLFDAVTSYNMYHPKMFSGETEEERSISFLNNCEKINNNNSKLCKELNIPMWPVAMPGYNDQGVRKEENHPSLSRLNGLFFERSLDQAYRYAIGSPKYIMITSYSEWMEDTQIEPAISYGNKYLEILKQFKDINH